MRIKHLCVSMFTFFSFFLISPLVICRDSVPKLQNLHIKSGETLLSYNVDMKQTSTSGTSAGGFMANQFHIGYSQYVIGSAMFSTGPYFCSKGSIFTAISQCMIEGKPNVDNTLTFVKEAFEAELIDDPSNLRDDKVYIFRGENDRWVGPAITDALYEQQIELLPEENVRYVKNEIPAGHGMVSLHYGSRCGTQGLDFINQCDYDAPGKLLEHIYGKLISPVKAKGKLLTFSQKEFVEDVKSSLAPSGFVYVPTACQKGELCRTHIVFHGCMQSYTILGDTYYSKLGYNDWGEANNIIMLYPQLMSSTTVPINPMGCWDWWGYSSSKFYSNEAPQMKAVFNMLKRVSGKN